MTRRILEVLIIVLLIGARTFCFGASPTAASPTIYIKADGSIVPVDAPILRNGTVYTLMDNITFSGKGIVIQRDNITLDGAGYTIRGTNTDNIMDPHGINLLARKNVTIINTRIITFAFAIYLVASSNNKIYGNIVENNEAGIYLQQSSSNCIAGNHVINNNPYGIYVTHFSLYNKVSGSIVEGNNYGILLHEAYNSRIFNNAIIENNVGINCEGGQNNFYQNNFMNNTKQVLLNKDERGLLPTGAWDNGVEGNFWSDYQERYPNATEVEDSGIWNTSYTMPYDNQDDYPLMSPYISGDYNHDGEVNMTDADMVRTSWQSRKGELNYNPHVDLDMNGVINIKDAAIIGVNWQKRYPG